MCQYLRRIPLNLLLSWQFNVLKVLVQELAHAKSTGCKKTASPCAVFSNYLVQRPPFSASAYQDSRQQLTIHADDQKIQILATDYPLGQLLETIYERTGVQFNFPESLNFVPVSIRIQASDWKSAIIKLFQDNSRLELWGENLASSKIWLYDYEDYPVSSEDFVVRIDAKETLPKLEIFRLAQEAPNVEHRLMAMEQFSYLGDDEETLPLLIFNLQADQAKIRSSALTLFKNLTEPLPLADIGRVAQSDSNQQIRMQALSLIAERVDEDDSKSYLLQALSDPSVEIRTLAQELLDDLGISFT